MKTEDEIRDIVDVDYEEVTTPAANEKEAREEVSEKKTVSMEEETPKAATVKADKADKSEQGCSASSKAKEKDLFGGQRTPDF